MGDHVLFIDFVERWLETAPIRYKATAVMEYEALLRLHLLPAFGRQRIDAIIAADVEQYLSDKVRSGLSPRTARNHLTVLRTLLKDATAFGLVKSNVAMQVRPPKQLRREQRFLSPLELMAVLMATPDAWKGLIAFPIYTAARKGECLSIRWPQIYFDRRQVAFISSMRRGVEYTVKTAASRATVPLADELAALLLARREQSADPVAGYVFSRSDGRPLDDGVPGRVVRKACLQAGIEPCGFHTLRHSAIAALIASGAHPKVVQEFARHASFDTTMSEYGHLIGGAAADAISDMARLISAPTNESPRILRQLSRVKRQPAV